MSHPVQLDFEILTLPETARRLGISAAKAEKIFDTVGYTKSAANGQRANHRKLKAKARSGRTKAKQHARKSH
jgi:hypothetical protein